MFCFLFFLSVYFKCRVTEGERLHSQRDGERSSICCSFCKWPGQPKPKPGARASSGPPAWVQGSSTWPPHVALPGALAGSWSRSGAARTCCSPSLTTALLSGWGGLAWSGAAHRPGLVGRWLFQTCCVQAGAQC